MLVNWTKLTVWLLSWNCDRFVAFQEATQASDLEVVGVLILISIICCRWMQKAMEEREVKVINTPVRFSLVQIMCLLYMKKKGTTAFLSNFICKISGFLYAGNCYNLPLYFPQDFYFRQLRKINVGGPVVGPEGRHSLLCTSNEFGLTFVGCGDGKLVVLTLPMMKLVSEPEPKNNGLVSG